jgi:hypothetical protein
MHMANWKPLLLAALLALPMIVSAQIFALPTEENEPDLILRLEDFVAQCPDQDQRNVFQYFQYTKFLNWYRSEWFSSEQEVKLKTLINGVSRKKSGRPEFEGYIDVRDLPPNQGKKPSPYELAPEHFPDFGWVRRKKPTYTPGQCNTAALSIKQRLARIDQGIRPPFPELAPFITLIGPDTFLSISRLMGDCKRSNFEPPLPFINSTSFEAWVSNNFSKSYGKLHKLSRPLLDQLYREVRALGGMAKAAQGFTLQARSPSECGGVDSQIFDYYHKHSML